MRALLVAISLLVLSVPAQATPRLPLHPCKLDASARCGTFRVPENRARPNGRTIALNVMVLPATGGKVAPDPLVYLAGGPGGAATELVSWIRAVFEAVNVHRDIVLVDQRGTGASRKLVCPPVSDSVTDPASLKRYVEACQRSLGADFTQYGTVTAMDDLDAVRAALGYRKVNVYGGSYGATAAQVYLNRHPGSVRTLMLDGGTLLEVPIFERWGSNAQRALDQIAARCASKPACSRAYPAWKDGLVQMIRNLEAEPVAVKVTGEQVTLDGDAVAGTVHELTLSPEGAAEVPRVVAHAEAGDFEPVARAAVRLGGDPESDRLVMRYAIMCDEPWAAGDPAKAAADAEGTYMFASVAPMLARWSLICGAFPHRSEIASNWRNPRSNVPALALVGGADPQDPIGNIAALRQTMPRTRILVAPGYGHGIGQIPCISRLVARFVALGTATGLDTSCIRKIETPEFGVD